MTIVIKITDERYKWIKEHKGVTDYSTTQMLYSRVRKGEVLAEPCSDAVSRQEVRDMLFWKKVDMGDAIYERLADITERLHTVHAEPRTGHWIFEEGDGKTCFDGYVCSACNKSFHTHVPYFAEYEFCPHCGADMREETNHE